MKKYLNIGCGSLFDPTWTNVDRVSLHDSVIAADVSRGLPFPDGAFRFVYHSHVLEHLLKDDGAVLIRECFRVLQPGGLIRVVVPDLESMARLYLENLELAAEGDKAAAANYDWMMIELYDQATRTTSGGLMREYLSQEELPAKDFVYSRLGENARAMHRAFSRQKSAGEPAKETRQPGFEQSLRALLGRSGEGGSTTVDEQAINELGRFRMSGEVHQWMYDRYSLRRLLLESGFTEFRILTAFESRLTDWGRFELDSRNGKVIKPESIFVEAVKPAP